MEEATEEVPSVEELRTTLQEREQELEEVRKHLANANRESADRRHLLKELEQNYADSEAAVSEYQKKLSQHEEKLSKLEQESHANAKAAAIERAIAEHRGIPELLRPALESMATLEDGAVRVGEQDIGEYVAQMRESERFGGAFMGRAMSGGGSLSSNGSGAEPRIPAKPRGEMKDSEKSAYIKRYGIEEYNSLPL